MARVTFFMLELAAVAALLAGVHGAKLRARRMAGGNEALMGLAEDELRVLRAAAAGGPSLCALQGTCTSVSSLFRRATDDACKNSATDAKKCEAADKAALKTLCEGAEKDNCKLTCSLKTCCADMPDKIADCADAKKTNPKTCASDEKVAMMCPKTCDVCDECADTGSQDFCSKRTTDECKNDADAKSKCRKTCQICKAKPSVCKDKGEALFCSKMTKEKCAAEPASAAQCELTCEKCKPSGDDCHNVATDQYCTAHSNDGTCKSDAYIMKNCKKTCKLCPGAATTTTTTTTVKPAAATTTTTTTKAPASDPNCKDDAPKCAQFANRCDDANVKKYCKKTCNLCAKPTAAPTCKDQAPKCAAYKSYCGTSDNVKTYCKATCGLCKSRRRGLEAEESAGPVEAVEALLERAVKVDGCKDTSDKCPNWQGHCQYETIKLQCPKTCDQCTAKSTAAPATTTTTTTTAATTTAKMSGDDPKAGCVDGNKHCKQWKEQGFCESTSVKTLCKKTCGLCS